MRLSTIAAASLILAAPAAQAATTTVFTDSLLVVVAEGAPDTAFSAANGNLPDGDRVSIDGNTGDYGPSGFADALLSFADFATPAGSAVLSAELEFFTKSFTNGPVDIYALAAPFDETTTLNALGPNGFGLFEDGVIAGSPVASATNIADESPISFDVTALVADWAAGAPAYGFGLFNNSGDGWDIQVVTDGDEFSPRLTVSYETDAVAPIPLPAAGWMLLSGIAGLIGLRRRACA